MKYTGSLAGENAVAGKWTADEKTASAGIDAAMTAGGIGAAVYATDADVFVDADVVIMEDMQVALAVLQADLAATTAADPTASTSAITDDIELLETAIAAASGTAAIEDTASDTVISSRLRIQIDANAESDAGVTFGARVRIQSGEGAAAAINAARFYARSGGFEVGVGNIYGALENMPGTYPVQIGFTDFGDNTAVGGRDAYSSGGLGASGSNGVEAIYSMGDFKAHVSASDTNNRVAAVGSYTTNGWTFAVGAQDSDLATDNEYVATIGGTIGSATLGLAYADNGTAGTRTVLSGSFAVGAATTVDAYYTDDELEDDSFGLGVHHSLGGGVTLQAGVGENFDGQTQADFGVKFNF